MDAFEALGNSVRRQILTELGSAALSVGDIASRFPISRPAISKHLRALQEAGLVEVTPDGARSLYSVRVAGFASVRAFLDDFWDEALQRLAAAAAQRASKRRRS